MGNKPSNIYQMDRPESGGADRKDERETSGLLERAKRDFAVSEKAKHEAKPKRTQRADGTTEPDHEAQSRDAEEK